MTFRAGGVRALVGLLLSVLCIAAPAAATPKQFGQADAAWHTAELEKAMTLYEEAIAAGGLEPGEVVIAYSRIGTVKAALKDNNGALSAFRIASSIDPDFELPADSGPVARKLYAKARKEAEAFGGEKLELAITVADTIPSNQPFTLETAIPEGFAVLVAEVVVTIEDPVSGKKWRRKQASQPKLTFEFPKRVAIRGARLKVKAAAVDAQNNAWTMAESKIKVEGVRDMTPIGDEPIEDKPKKSEKKFDLMEGPVPWIVGGAVLLGGIVVTALVLNKPNDVAVGSPTWQ